MESWFHYQGLNPSSLHWKVGFWFFIFLAVLGLCCCVDFSLVAVSRGCSLGAVHGLFTVVASPVVEQGLPSCWTSVAVAWAREHRFRVAHQLSCRRACGTFPDQRLNTSLLHWQVTLPLRHQGSLYKLISERLPSTGHQGFLELGNCCTSLRLLSNGLCLALGFRGVRSVNTPTSSTVVPEPRGNGTEKQKPSSEEAELQGEATTERFHLISTAKVSAPRQDQPPDGGVSLPAGVPRPKPPNLPSEAPDMAKQRQAVAAISKFRHGPTASVSTIKGCCVPLSFGEVCDAVMVTGTVLLCDSQLPADAQHCLPV